MSIVSPLLLLLASCIPTIINGEDWWTPQKGLTFQWQLTGTIDTTQPVDVFDVDLFDTSESTIELIHSKGAKVVCYFSAGTWENWREDEADFPRSAMGMENGWPGERWLDVNVKEVRNIAKRRMKLAATKGCDGVEADNVNVWQIHNTGVTVTGAQQIKFNKFLSKKAHKFGLAIGLKNNIEQLDELHKHFDFAVNEECYDWKECEAYVSTFLADNKPVFNVEYEYSSLENGLPSFCKDMNSMGISSIFKGYSMDAPLCSCTDLNNEGVTISMDCDSLL